MKNKLLVAGAVVASISAPAAFASYFNAPYIGAEVIQTNQDYKNGYGHTVLKKNPQDYSVFGGFNFYKNFGAEVGYEFQPKRNKTVNLNAGNIAVNGSTALTANSVFNTNVKGTHPYVGLFAETTQKFSMIGCVKFQALLAASVSHVKSAVTLVSSDGVIQNITRNYSKTKVVPMVKLSATSYVTKNFGIRVSGNYRNTSAIKMNAKEGGTSSIRLKDTFGVGLGVLYSFN